MSSLKTRTKLVLLVLASAACLSPCRASPDSVVTFNEVHYHPADALTDTEWIELHNQMAVRIDLSAWQITGGVNFTFAEGTIIEPGGFLVVAAAPERLADASGPWVGSLNNG
ncbi:MAG: lamin tail domain-containing protein, partial [Verrucomicrobiales bacterium]